MRYLLGPFTSCWDQFWVTRSGSGGFTNKKLQASAYRTSRLDENNWAVDGRRPSGQQLCLARRIQIVHRRPIGVVVDGHQPQRRIAGIAGKGGRDVVGLWRVWLGAETRTRPSIWLVRIDVEGHVNWRYRHVASRRRQRRLIEAKVFRDSASIPSALKVCSFTL